ncbi:conserved hypothetical protein [Sphingomonas sp. 8AM]|nr:conserved hypothetical protein [Sphingomonas sp. 8AM]
MMKRLLPIACLLLAGCVTTLKSERDTGANDGLVYSLPIPVIYVVPQPNGTMNVSVEYFSDPKNSYVLRTHSFVSNHTLDVQRDERGLLKQVSLDAKSDAVAAAAIESAGNLAKAQSDAAKKDDEAVATKVEAQAKAVADAQLELDIAKAKYDLLIERKAATDKQLEAELALKGAEAKLKRAAAIASGANLAYNAPGVAAPATPEAAAPVMFRVMPVDPRNGELGVKLVAFEGPRSLPTSIAAKPAEPAAAALLLTPTNGGIVRVEAGKPVQLVLVSNQALKRLVQGSLELKRVGSDDNLASSLVLSASPDPKADKPTIVVNLDQSIPADTYLFNVAIELPSGQPVSKEPVQFTVAR